MSRFFLSAWGENEAAGIYTFDLKENGYPEKEAFIPFFHAGYLAWNSTRRFLYATGGLNENTDCVGAFAVSDDGKLTLLNKEASCGCSCCHLCVAPDDCFVYAANYTTGNFTEFSLRSDGSLSPAVRTFQHEGKGPHPERQRSAHTHFCSFTPDGKYLLVIDLGIDAVMAYPYVPGKGIEPEKVIRTDVAPGRGPRHLIFDRSGKIAYLITELGNTVMSFACDDGRFALLHEVSTLPCRIDYPTKASAIRLSADERFLIATNRGFDTVAVFSLDGAGGMVLADLTLSGGKSPRDVNFLGNGRFFAAGNEFSDDVYFFDFNRETGKLTPNGHKLTLPRPLCFCE